MILLAILSNPREALIPCLVGLLVGGVLSAALLVACNNLDKSYAAAVPAMQAREQVIGQRINLDGQPVRVLRQLPRGLYAVETANGSEAWIAADRVMAAFAASVER